MSTVKSTPEADVAVSTMPSLGGSRQESRSLTGSRSLIEQTFQRVRADILHGRLPAGSKLPIEELKACYQVSGGTLREALSLLVSDGLVRAQAQRGFQVAPMSQEDMRDLSMARVLLECLYHSGVYAEVSPPHVVRFELRKYLGGVPPIGGAEGKPGRGRNGTYLSAVIPAQAGIQCLPWHPSA